MQGNIRFELSQGYENSEIALMMNVSVRTVEAHIYKALKSLRARLGIFFVFLYLFIGY